MRRVTVVIPTFNRREVLTKAIRAHLVQSALSEIKEILVIDDGSTDGTEVRVCGLATGSPVPIRYWQHSNRGPAAARNVGIREATGEIILFSDDDIIPAPGLLAEHLRWHDQHPDIWAAVLGYVTWSPEVRPTPFMKWCGLDGPLFAYAHFFGRAELDFRYFYTCNLSLKTEFLRRTGIFDEDFRRAAFEDAELGYRLQKNGLQLLYNPDAVGYHYRYMTFADVCSRARLVAEARKILDAKEAGKELAAIERAELQARPRVGRFLRKVFYRCAVPTAPLLKPLLDTSFPLPWPIYRFMHQRYAER